MDNGPWKMEMDAGAVGVSKTDTDESLGVVSEWALHWEKDARKNG